MEESSKRDRQEDMGSRVHCQTSKIEEKKDDKKSCQSISQVLKGETKFSEKRSGSCYSHSNPTVITSLSSAGGERDKETKSKHNSHEGEIEEKQDRNNMLKLKADKKRPPGSILVEGK
ncbi:hypothetical protein PAMP_015607 [Pampus punctatissimus]